MAPSTSRPSRPDPSDSVLLFSVAALLAVLLAVFFLAACTRHVAPDTEIAATSQEREAHGSRDKNVASVAKTEISGGKPAEG